MREELANSGALDVYFAMAEGQRRLLRPLYFHHVPKTAGTSFRVALRSSLEEQRLGRIQVPAIRTKLKSAKAWPQGFLPLYVELTSDAAVEVVASHYTSLLVDVLDGPILAVIREPDAHMRSAMAFSARRLGEVAERAGNLRRILRDPKVNNAQTRSLAEGWDVHIPKTEPGSKAKRAAAMDLVERILDRYVLFTTERFEMLLAHCKEQHGLTLDPLVRKRRRRDLYADQLVAELSDIAERDGYDPLWLDRILYSKVAARLG